MCQIRLQTDDLVDMISTTVHKKDKMRGDLRLQVLLKSVHKTLNRELRKKQRSLRRKYRGLLTTIKNKQDDHVQSEDSSEGLINNFQQNQETPEDIFGLDDFFRNLKAVDGKNNANPC